jgi:hypothetical protein
MDILAAITTIASVTLATTFVALILERRMDVLYGPYIEGRESQLPVSLSARLTSTASMAIDRLRCKARNIVYVTSLVAC